MNVAKKKSKVGKKKGRLGVPRTAKPAASLLSKAARHKAELEKVLPHISEFPLVDAFVSPNWQSLGLATVAIARELPSGRLVLCSFLADLGCLGVKNLMMKIIKPEQLSEIISQGESELEPCTPELAAKIVELSAEYGTANGFAQHRDFHLGRQIYADISIENCEETVPLGKEGKPFFMPGPRDDTTSIIAHLTERFGPDGFHYLMGFGMG